MSHVKTSLVVAVALLFCLAPHEARGQEIVVTLLGTGSLIPEVERFGPSILLQAGNQTLIFDVGRGAYQRLAQVGVAASQVDAIFLTHFHADHDAGEGGGLKAGVSSCAWVVSPPPLMLRFDGSYSKRVPVAVEQPVLYTSPFRR